jgi:hypothetical protein
MSKINDPLRTTAQELHRVWFTVHTTKQWYAIMHECRIAFGDNWRGQSKVRKKLIRQTLYQHVLKQPLEVWFDMPDTRVSTWISMKLGIGARERDPKVHK